MFLTKAESILSTYLPRYLRVLQYYQGVGITLYIAEESTFSDVYGTHSVKQYKPLKKIIGVVTTSPNTFPFSLSLAPTLTEGYLYTYDPSLVIGSVISLDRINQSSRRYVVEGRDSIGTTQTVWFRNRISMTEENIL